MLKTSRIAVSGSGTASTDSSLATGTGNIRPEMIRTSEGHACQGIVAYRIRPMETRETRRLRQTEAEPRQGRGQST